MNESWSWVYTNPSIPYLYKGPLKTFAWKDTSQSNLYKQALEAFATADPMCDYSGWVMHTNGFPSIYIENTRPRTQRVLLFDLQVPVQDQTETQQLVHRRLRLATVAGTFGIFVMFLNKYKR